LKQALAQRCHKVSLHSFLRLIGLIGNIYRNHTELPLSKLGLDRCKISFEAKILTIDLDTYSIQYPKKSPEIKWEVEE